jgi:hypothetical protein
MEYNVDVDQGAIHRIRQIISSQIDVELYYDDVVNTMSFLGDSATAPVTTTNGAVYYNISSDPVLGSKYLQYVDGAWTKISESARADGDQVVIAGSEVIPGDAVEAYKKSIATWSGAAWVFVAPKLGDTVKVAAGYNSQKIFKFDGTDWVNIY